jgi:hypothetical protein
MRILPFELNLFLVVDLTMKRPDGAVSRPDTPLPSSRSQVGLVSQPLEDIHTSFSLSNGSQQQDGSGELNLLSESNHAHYLLESFHTSDLYQAIENRLGRSETQNGIYTVWVDAPGQESSVFSIYQFYHEVVSMHLTVINLCINNNTSLCFLLVLLSISTVIHSYSLLILHSPLC